MAATQSDPLDILAKATVTPEQSRALVSAVKVGINRATDSLATKRDAERISREMAETRQWLELKIAGLRSNLEAKIEIMHGNLRAEISQCEGRTTQYITEAIFWATLFLLWTTFLLVAALRN